MVKVVCVVGARQLLAPTLVLALTTAPFCSRKLTILALP